MLELSGIQGIGVRGYRMMHARYCFLSFSSTDSARRWLDKLVNDVTLATPWDSPPPSCLNLAFSYSGLEKLGLGAESLASFPTEFREDLAKRAAALGDVGASSPQNWTGGLGNPELHALLIISSNDTTRIETESERLRLLAEELGGVIELSHQDAGCFDGDREHFGFRDGVTTVAMEGTGQQPQPGSRLVKAGEFILGYPDETGALPASPSPEELGRNACFLVYRRLYQDVEAFRRFVALTAVHMQQDEEWVAAKLMGRWRSGAPLVLSPEQDDPAIAQDPVRRNDFTYKDMDPRGFFCPRGAHIRRTNPRDELGESEQHRHLVQRRGLPYGPPLPEGASDDGLDRGIVGVMVNASIARQFEFIQKVWINNPKFGDLPDEHDPIAGHNDGTKDLTIPRRPIRKVVRNLPGFTVVKGGGYFFAPGLRGLEYLSKTH